MRSRWADLKTDTPLKISYSKDFDLYWPDEDQRPASSLHGLKKNITDMDLTIEKCYFRRVCVQAGGHVGLWPRRLASHFGKVISFEPVPEMFECMRLNGIPTNVQFYNAGLGAEVGVATLHIQNTMGSSRLDTQGNNINTLRSIEIELTTIDSLNLDGCDAIFLDIEGNEPNALEGARRTIMELRPIIHIEMLPFARKAIEKKLIDFKYTKYRSIHHDEIWVPR